jgi:aspartyl-tRNA(Asn)/glutamyl-tRNA(Gln) amidotransferase subunit C
MAQSNVEQFSVEQIEKIAKLANLELTDAEKRLFAEQFGHILDYFKKIQTVQLPPDEALAGPPQAAVMRDDVAEVSGVTAESFSPYLEDHHFKVPKVVE